MEISKDWMDEAEGDVEYAKSDLKGNYTVASDADLLVIYRGKERKDAYAIIKRTLGLPRLEPHVYSDSEYKKMTENGIVLF